MIIPKKDQHKNCEAMHHVYYLKGIPLEIFKSCKTT